MRFRHNNLLLVLVLALSLWMSAQALAVPSDMATDKEAVDTVEIFMYKAKNHHCADCWNMLTKPCQEVVVSFFLAKQEKYYSDKKRPVPASVNRDSCRAVLAKGRAAAVYGFFESIANAFDVKKFADAKNLKTTDRGWEVKRHEGKRVVVGLLSNRVYTTQDFYVEKYGDIFLIDFSDFLNHEIATIKTQK